jgi:PAS domain S-box-containing protein
MASGRRGWGLMTRTIVASVLLGVLVVGGRAVMTVAVQQLRDASQAQVRSVQVLAATNELERSLLDLETGERGFLLTGDHAFLVPYVTALSAYPRQARALAALTAGSPAQTARVAAIDASIGRYVRGWAQPLIRLADAGKFAQARRLVATGGGKQRVDALRAQFSGLTRAESRLAAARAQRADSLGRLAIALGLGGIVLSALAVIAFTAVIRRSVVVPLRRLAQAVARLSGGDLSARVAHRGTAEVGELAAGVNTMAENLQQSREALDAQRTRLADALGSIGRQKAVSDLLRRFGDDLAAASGVEEVSATALTGIADTARAEIGVLYLEEDSKPDLVPVAARGLTDHSGRPRLAIGEGLAGRAAAERKPVQAAGGQGSLRLAGVSGNWPAARELHLPLLYGERALGVVSLGRSSDEQFTGPALEVLKELANQAAVACAEALSVRQVRQSVHELQTVLASTDEGICAIGRDRKLLLVNDAALARTGYSRQELLGKDLHRHLHHSYPDGSPYPVRDCPIQGVLDTGRGQRVTDEVFWRRDGSSFPVEYSADPLLQGAEVTGVVITFRDITSRTRTEQQRAAQYAATRVIASARGDDRTVGHRVIAAACEGLNLPIGIGWTARSDQASLFCNAVYAAPGFEDLAARLAAGELAAGEGLPGLALYRREPVLLRDLTRDAPRPGLPEDPRLRSAIAVPALGAGDHVLVIAEFFAERDLAGEGVASTLTAIGGQVSQYLERRRAEEQTQRVRDDFVSTVSHELRTPLTSINGWLHILLGGEPGPLTDEQREFLTTIKRNSDRLLRQVGDLLLAGHLAGGELTLELADVDMTEVARDAADLVAAQAAGKRITLTLQAGEPVIVRGDRERLLQLLDNLIVNAIKFTPEDGRVGLSVSHADGQCRVEVSDTGIGVPPDERSRLFQRFFRASTATNQGISGTGLGLAICKAIASSHHGTIYLADRSGPGSVFVVKLPLAASKEAAA